MSVKILNPVESYLPPGLGLLPDPLLLPRFQECKRKRRETESDGSLQEEALAKLVTPDKGLRGAELTEAREDFAVLKHAVLRD
jgi:hypothetical protein